MRENLHGGSLKLLVLFILLAANIALAAFAPSWRETAWRKPAHSAPNESDVARP